MDGQRGKSLDELLEMAAENQVSLNATVKDIARAVGVEPVEAEPKSRARAIEKFEQDADYSEYGELADLARASFVISDPAQADRIVAALRQRIAVFDKGWIEQNTGYLDRKLLLRFANGGAAEIQIIPEKIYAFKEKAGGHDAYKISRDATSTAAEREAARRIEREGYAAARAGSVFEDAGSLARSASGNSLRNAASDIGAPSVSSLMVKADANAPDGMEADFHSPSRFDQTNPTPSTNAQGRQSYSRSSTDIDASDGNIGLDNGESNVLADAVAGAAVRDFDDPAGPAAISQTDHLFHDLRMDADAAAARAAGDGIDDIDDSTGDLFALNAADEAELRAAIAEADADDAALAAMRACLPGGPRP